MLPIGPTAETPELPAQTDWERMLADYRHTSVSVGVHPLELLRPHLARRRLERRARASVPHGAQIAVAGMAVARQRPATAKGIVFMLLEDEHGQFNLIVPPQVYEEHRAIVRGEPLILARGRFERVGRNENVLVETRRDARPARAPRRERGRGARVAAAGAPLRPPLTRCGVGTPACVNLESVATTTRPAALRWRRWCSSRSR